MGRDVSRRDLLNYLVGLGSLATASYLLKGGKGNSVADEIQPVDNFEEIVEDVSVELDKEDVSEVNGDSEIDADYLGYTGGFEGRRNRVYDARPNDPNVFERTIGIGHYLDRGDSRETFARVLPKVNYDDIYSGEAILSDGEIDRLFESDIETYIERARRSIHEFDDLPGYLREALVDMSYRGDLRGSPRAMALMNAGRWEDAGDEYVNSAEYDNAEENQMRGLITRMNSNQERMFRYSGRAGNE